MLSWDEEYPHRFVVSGLACIAGTVKILGGSILEESIVPIGRDSFRTASRCAINRFILEQRFPNQVILDLK